MRPTLRYTWNRCPLIRFALFALLLQSAAACVSSQDAARLDHPGHFLSRTEIDAALARNTMYIDGKPHAYQSPEGIIMTSTDDFDPQTSIMPIYLREFVRSNKNYRRNYILSHKVNDRHSHVLLGGRWRYDSTRVAGASVDTLCLGLGFPTVNTLTNRRGWKILGEECFLVKKTSESFSLLCTDDEKSGRARMCQSTEQYFNVLHVDQGDSAGLVSFYNGETTQALKRVRAAQGALLAGGLKLFQQALQ